MRQSTLKLAFLILPVAALLAASLAAPACFGQQSPSSQQPAAPAQQPPPPTQQPASQTPDKPQPSTNPANPADPPRPSSSPNSDYEESSSKKDVAPEPEPKKDEVTVVRKAGVLPPEDDPAWDPFHAQQDIDVGMFYLHKGDVDAAISRFEDAIRLRANFAKPRLLIAEAYEKKGDPTQALHYYKEYLQVLPNAADAKKVQEKIAKLSKK
jgi:tetratricopeptide (TPR) repeat protein